MAAGTWGSNQLRGWPNRMWGSVTANEVHIRNIADQAVITETALVNPRGVLGGVQAAFSRLFGKGFQAHGQ